MQQIIIKEFVPDLPLNQIDIAEENVRKSKQKVGIDDLKSSIQQFGLIHPVVVVAKDDGRYDLIVGQRRYIAFTDLQRTTIPALVIHSVKSTTKRIASFAENIRRRNLPYEDTILLCEQLYEEFKGTKAQKIKQIAKVLALSPSTVSEYLAQQLVPTEVRKLVDEGKLSKDIAYRITAAFYPNIQKIISIAKDAILMTREENKRALDYANKNTSASVAEILDYAKNPPPFIELRIRIEPDTEKILRNMAKKRNKTVDDLVLYAINRFIKEEG